MGRPKPANIFTLGCLSEESPDAIPEGSSGRHEFQVPLLHFPGLQPKQTWHTHFTHAWLGKSSAWTICLNLQSYQYPWNMRSCLQKGVQEYCPCLLCQAPAGVAWNLTLLDNEIVRQNLSLDSFWCLFAGLSRSNHFSPSLCNFMCPDLFFSQNLSSTLQW